MSSCSLQGPDTSLADPSPAQPARGLGATKARPPGPQGGQAWSREGFRRELGKNPRKTGSNPHGSGLLAGRSALCSRTPYLTTRSSHRPRQPKGPRQPKAADGWIHSHEGEHPPTRRGMKPGYLGHRPRACDPLHRKHPEQKQPQRRGTCEGGGQALRGGLGGRLVGVGLPFGMMEMFWKEMEVVAAQHQECANRH